MQKKITEIFETLRASSGLVGGAVALIRNGKVDTWFLGHSDREAGLPVSEETYFDIASCSKSFTAMTAALAVDKGWLEWDTPIQHYLPDFGVADPKLSAEITMRDLLSHRTGLPRLDFIDNLKIPDRNELCQHFRHLEATFGLRESYQYNNQMYTYVGYVLEHITGRTYEQWLMEDLAKEAGLGIRVRSVPGCMEGLEHAKPYRTNGKGACLVDYSMCPSEAPCGSVRARAKDLVDWMRLMAAGGVLNGKRLISEAQWAQLLQPNIETEPGQAYAMGWRVTKRGEKTVYYHGGDIRGFNSVMGFLPGEDSGFVVLVNTNGTWGEDILASYLMDELCGTRQADIDRDLAAWRKEREAYDARRRELEQLPAAQDESLVGTYFHPAYQQCVISADGVGLWLDYGVMRYRLLQKGNEYVGVWRCPFVPEDYEVITLKKEGEDLQLYTGESTLWFRFEKIA